MSADPGEDLALLRFRIIGDAVNPRLTPAEQLIPTAEAIIRVFDRHGDRRPDRMHRMRSRMKFLAREWGIEKLRTAVFVERRAILATPWLMML